MNRSSSTRSRIGKQKYPPREDDLVVIADPVVEYSAHQKRIFGHMETVLDRPRKSAAISAAAGSGKSFTIRALIKALLAMMKQGKIKRGNIASLQFNKHIKEEMEGKIGQHPNLDVMTVSGSGLAVLKFNKIYPRGNIKFKKYYDLIQLAVGENFSYIKGGMMKEDADSGKEKDDSLRKKFCSQLTDIVNMTMNTLTPLGDTDAGLDMVERYGLECSSTRLFRVAKDVIEKAIDQLDSGMVAFQDMLYGPYYLDLEFPKYDWIFCDECQDFSALQLEIINRFRHENTVMFGFGDFNQSIMAFAGALSDSFQQFVEKFQCRTLPLSVCYRCPSKVLDLARILVPSIRNRDNCPEGIVEVVEMKEVMADKAVAGDYFLCRMTAPLVQMCIMLIKLRKSAVVKGREIGDKLIELYGKIVEYSDADALITQKKMFDCAEFLAVLKKYRVEEVERMVKKNSSAFSIEAFNDRADCLAIISEYLSAEAVAHGVKDHHSSILNEVNKLFPKDQDISSFSVILCTVHKSKGLEANRIFIIDANKMPHVPKNKPQSTEQRQQEINILYVALTRAKNELYIQGDGFHCLEDFVAHLKRVTPVREEESSPRALTF